MPKPKHPLRSIRAATPHPTQAAFAAFLGIPLPVLKAVESGKGAMTPRLAARVREMTGADDVELLRGPPGSARTVTGRDKIAMFNQEEIKIFRDCGFAPVFFGEGVIGERLPHLTYMVGFDNMAAREKAWDAFRSNPDWARVRVKPGWTDAEAVSNSHTSFLRPTAYSQIR